MSAPTIRMSESVRRWPAAALLLLSALLFGYAAVRAYEVSVTYGESYSFLPHVRKGVLYPPSTRWAGTTTC